MRQHPLTFETIHNATVCQDGRLIKKNLKIVKAAATKKVETVIGSMRTTVVRLYLKRSGEVYLQVKSTALSTRLNTFGLRGRHWRS